VSDWLPSVCVAFEFEKIRGVTVMRQRGEHIEQVIATGNGNRIGREFLKKSNQRLSEIYKFPIFKENINLLPLGST